MESPSNELSKLTVSPPRIVLSSAVPSPLFSDEIFIDILSRLPAKSLFQFKCVSKSCYWLISEPYFKKMHLNRTKNLVTSQKLLFGQYSDNFTYSSYTCSLPLQKLLFGLYSDNYTYSSYTCSLSLDDELVNDIRGLYWPSICGIGCCYDKTYCSCDGLLLVGVESGYDGGKLLLCNPTTGESIVLPDPKFQGYRCCYGLGYDSTSDDYKVLRINAFIDDGKSHDKPPHEILSLKDGSWRTIDDGNVSDSLIKERDCLGFVDGAFHWLGRLKGSSRTTVVSFSISDEMYREIPVPNIDFDISEDVDMGVSVLGGMLCVHFNDWIAFELWAMKDYGVLESWTRLLITPTRGVWHHITPLYRFSDGEVLLCIYTDTGENTFVIYDSGRSAFTNRMWPLEPDDFKVYHSFLYTESLISPNLGH